MRKMLSINFIIFLFFCFTACESNEPKSELENTLWEYSGKYNYYGSTFIDYYEYINFEENGKVKIWGDHHTPIVGSYDFSNNKIIFSNCQYYNSRQDVYYLIEEGEFSSMSITIYYRYKRELEDSYGDSASRVYIRKL